MGKIIAAVLVVLVAGFFIYALASKPDPAPSVGVPFLFVSDDEQPKITYYYGEECPHCKDVMKFLEENKIAEKVTFEKKEVWHDRENSQEMMQKAKTCEENKKTKCFIGTPDVTGFFKKAAGL